MKAKTALTLSKTYRQDQALEWGFLTEPEVSHIARRGTREPDRDRRTEAGPRPRTSRIRRGAGVILEGIVTTLSLDGALNIAPMGPRGRPGPEHGAVRAPPVPHVDDLPQPEGARRGRASTSPTTCCSWPRRRSARPSTPLPATRPADVVAGPDPARRLPLLRVPRRRARRPRGADDDRRRDRRPGTTPRLLRLQPGQARRASRRRSWRRARPGCRCDEMLARVPQAGGPGRQDRRPDGARGLHALAPACPRGRRPAGPRPGPEAHCRHDRSTSAHPDAEPLALRPAGLGARLASPVRRRRPHDRRRRASS